MDEILEALHYANDTIKQHKSTLKALKTQWQYISGYPVGDRVRTKVIEGYFVEIDDLLRGVDA